MMENNHVELWNRCLQVIRDNVPEPAFNTWFKPIIPLKYENKTLTVEVPSQFFYEFIEEKYLGLLRSVLYKEIGEGTRLMYSVLTDKTNHITTKIPSTNQPTVPQPQAVTGANRTPFTPQQTAPALDPRLNPKYRFDNFIEGESNKLPRTVAEEVALRPAKTAFNPLFIYGASGVGKTHLVNAIGARIKELYPQKRVLYVSSNLFQVQFVDATLRNKVTDFINFYQTIDVLIIDDIQEFAAMTKTQNTFFHIFNHLHQNGKQLILTSDRPPVALQGMEDRLLTRFKWGLLAELEKPNTELRKNILKDKIHRDGLEFPEPVINFIAENVNESVRDLEGVVNSLMAYSAVYNKDIDINLAESVVKKIAKVEKKEITIDTIISKVCEHYDIEKESLHSRSRKHNVAIARQVAMYLAKKYTDTSCVRIGKLIAKRNHSTVLHSCKMVQNQLEIDKNFRSEMEEIENMIRC